ncbi:MAG: transcriptional repressor [Clostridia bacterium]|nr:transcriptional repressor [Clostridia bacterium]
MKVIEVLQKKGIRPSITRVKILEYLRSVCSHPTVSEVYAALIDEIPTLSLTTVYNTLKLFAENGIVKALTIDGTNIRYDGCTDFHGHFMCSQCGTVYDFEISSAGEKGLENFKVSTKEVFYSGVCSQCL